MAKGNDPVSVLLGNREVLVVLFAVVAWVWNKVVTGKKKAGARPAPGGRVQTARGETADQVAERTRRVQEEVRRKIAERRAAAAPPRLVVPRVTEEKEPGDEAVEFERQQKLAAQMRALDAARAAAAQQASALASGFAFSGSQTGLPQVNPWLADLRDPGGVRRAIILREVLGPPLSLKGSL